MRPTNQELQERAQAADQRLRQVARRSETVRQLAFDRLSAKLPIERLDLYGNLPNAFHGVVYFKSSSEAATFDNASSRKIVDAEIRGALTEVDPKAGEPEIKIDIDSIERMEATQEGYFKKFR